MIPLKALVLNALSVAAAYGVLALVFDHPIEAWIPVFLFAALFGLSMDYEVFMVSRIREAHDAGEGDTSAVAHGLQQTGAIVTAAAAIMVASFAGFAVGRIEGLREFGVGLAVAVDARRDDRASHPGSVRDGRARPLELVAAEAPRLVRPARPPEKLANLVPGSAGNQVRVEERA